MSALGGTARTIGAAGLSASRAGGGAVVASVLVAAAGSAGAGFLTEAGLGAGATTTGADSVAAGVAASKGEPADGFAVLAESGAVESLLESLIARGVGVDFLPML